MKALRFAVTLLLIAAIFTGCKARNNDNNLTSPAPAVNNPPVVSQNVADELEERANEAVPNINEDIRDGVSDFEDAIDRDNINNRDDNIIDNDNLTNDNDANLTEEERRLLAESAVSAMSTDFTQIGALDAEKKGWGSGGPADNQGRPDGATLYQNKYKQYDAIFIGPAEGNKIYLTFDEGYENGYTAAMLDTLKEKSVRAVFFITLDYAKSQPELVKRMVAEGHMLGNHSCAHKSFPEMQLQDAADDVMKLHTYVKANFGYEMTLFRPPMGEFSEQTLALLQSLRYKSIFWSFAHRDWLVDDQPLTAEALSLCAGKAHPGAIYLLHAVSQTNAEILGEFIDVVRDKGYEFAPFYI